MWRGIDWLVLGFVEIELGRWFGVGPCVVSFALLGREGSREGGNVRQVGLFEDALDPEMSWMRIGGLIELWHES